MRMVKSPKVRSVLLLMNLIFLFLLGMGFSSLRLLDEELANQTALELSAQGAAIAAFYQRAYVERLPNSSKEKENRISPFPPPLIWDEDQILPERPPSRKAAHFPGELERELGLKMEEVLPLMQESTLAGMRLLDEKGVVIATSGEDRNRSFAHLEEVQRALQGKPTNLLRWREDKFRGYSLFTESRNTATRVFVALPLFHGQRVIGVILLSRTPKSVVKALFEKRHRLFLAFVALVIFLAGFSWLSAHFITTPLKELIKRAKKISKGHWLGLEEGAVGGAHEMELLGRAMIEMSQRLEHRSVFLRNFAMQVSHEFKTPLTSLRGAVELLRNHEGMATEKRERFLGNMEKDANRLTALIQRLMELAQADLARPSEEVADLRAVIERVGEHHRELGLKLLLALPEQSLQVGMSDEVLETILYNLLGNAAQHGAETVELKVTLNGDRALLRVQDDGQGVSEANRKKIFEPFFTTKRSFGGTGLGLSIVKSLLEGHHGEIRLLESHQGACFELEVPLWVCD